jgi:hypothetical protein
MCHPYLLVADVHRCLEFVHRDSVDGLGTVAAVVVGRSSYRFRVPLVAGIEVVVELNYCKLVVTALPLTLEEQGPP